MAKIVRGLLLTLITALWGSDLSATSNDTSQEPSDCVITDYGAKAEARLNTQALQAAIDECAERGGRVVIPKGKFRTATLYLKSRMELHLQAGAILMGSDQLQDYPPITSRSGKPSWHLLYAQDVEQVTVSGRGVIDGQGESFWDEDFYSLGIPRPTLPRPTPWLFFDGCNQVVVKDITMRHSPAHNLTFRDCSDVRVSGVTVRNDFRSPNTDGIQVIRSKNIEITGCTISTGDDGIVLISEADNIRVKDCYIESDDSALKFGIASKYGVRNTHFSDITIRRSQIGIAVFMRDGGEHKNNLFERISIHTDSRHPRDYPIYVDIDRRTPQSTLGRITKLTLRDIDIQTDGNILIAGNQHSLITNLVLDGIQMTVTDPLAITTDAEKPTGDIRYELVEASDNLANVRGHFVFGSVKDASISNIKLTSVTENKSTARDVFVLRNAHRMSLSHVQARRNSQHYGKSVLSQSDSSGIKSDFEKSINY